MKNILVLAYNFPPAQNGAVARFWAYYLHLHKYGYNPIIITVNNFGNITNEKDVYRFDSIAEIPRRPYWKRFLKKRVKKYFYDKYDPTFDFIFRKQVMENIDFIINKHKLSAIYSSFPNSESNYLGLKISQKYNLPLISEFRDGYAHETIIQKQTSTNKLFIKKFEEKIVEKSALIITVTEGLTTYFKNEYSKSKVFTIFNGYEESDFIEVDKINNSSLDKKIKIVNYGSIDISGERDVSPLFFAIKNLKDKRYISYLNFELSLIGKYSKKELSYITDLKINDIIKTYPPVSKIEGLKFIKQNYNYLLLYGLPGIAHNIPSKAFEYIRLGLPILGICEGNESAELIKSSGTGETCDFSIKEIEYLFLKAVHSNIDFAPKHNIISEYRRENQVKKFADILKKLNI